MLDMDGTILDLAFDNYMWFNHVPDHFAEAKGMPTDEARTQLYAKFEELLGRLEWYCLDHWSEVLGVDVTRLHREQHHRIGYLPGAEDFLETVAQRDIRVLMVTNSHVGLLDLKHEVTGVKEHFDAIHSSHHFGFPKERQEFWHALREVEKFDPETTLFVDDSAKVLDSAHEYGVSMLLEITRPDTTRPERTTSDFSGIRGLSELL